MLHRNSRSAPKPASATHDDDVVTRALQLIKPKPERTEESRKQVVEAIAGVACASERIAPAYWTSREVRELTDALRAAMAALKHHLARGVFRHPSELTADRLHEELAAFAAAAEAQYRLRRGKRGNGKKFTAAWEAHDILRSHGVEPTLYKDGKFFRLAAMLFEAATGIADEDLSRACKRVARRFRQ